MKVRELVKFKASREWVFRYNERTGIHNVSISGESASADKVWLL